MDQAAEDPEVQALLRSISEAAPAGEDLRHDFSAQSLYYRLRDARAEARAAERAADTDGDVTTPPQWRQIVALATDALAGHSKDLEIAAWYTEAALRLRGLAGLAAGCRLMSGLVDLYWDGLHPLPDEDGLATRVAPIVGLNGLDGDGTLIQPLRKAALFHRPDGTPFALWQYLQSTELAGIGDASRRAQRIQTGTVPFETVEAEARAADVARWAVVRDESAAAAAGWSSLGSMLDAKAGASSPSIGRVRDLLAEISAIVARFAPADARPQTVVPAGTASDAVMISTDAVPLLSRERALVQLEEIADFFRRTEPHSPLSYTLNEAARRGRLSWPELLQEVVPDAASRRVILTTLGILPGE